MSSLADYSYVIIHGSFGSPDINWFPWLKKELKNAGAKSVLVPQFPINDQQSVENWLKTFSEKVGEPHSQMVLIGHSIGAAFILRLLEKAQQPVKAAFLVSSFVHLLDNAEFDGVNKTFVQHDFQWSKIKENAGDFYIYHGDNDPYVPLWMGEEVANELGVELRIIKDGGHISARSGFSEFGQLWQDIQKLR